MIIYPAIDIKNGKCVRLYQGDPSKETVYGSDPLTVARRWESLGATWLHIVDLDGAFAGRPVHYEVIARIASTLSIPVQVGGGIRNSEDVEKYLEAGISRVIVGTRALKDPEWFSQVCTAYPGRIAAGLDARNGFVAVKGWKNVTSVTVAEVARIWNDLPLAALIYTDIARDGTQRGVNVKATESLLKITRHPVIASGGVASIEDILVLLPLVKEGLNGVIVGRALYTGSLKLEEAIRIVNYHLSGRER
ncbi:1-(5-phosphoribosyl)-5-[(5-phosphoribosylamino)methylideneamino]imidazole-4-carboxamide isomerase [Thermodesulforhabdus norvegica]|uniref:1-(5-phosphoribosyl)-5-[(5-phosphoribosylamino)methylideneamino] imidazole-4-carboxamide isomerase n=1 Tax=Thermodesulforhabdus norvegica TaxID=39841 RepID=A0A1I4SKD7_9BACT|nr:1-(5-phosphoribosyl)-5-[(5-phosphoribosylamino)methylideneamino]imidazole-4-carboxamide isomerase [Thermodesulforhabdus norvegica]SFM64978.1 1-(5-phosphoribosyl)-5-[(5-phosphoribosylamino)methylideneamino] imidazole-4-carboxamide isomerase [Thermodesulforhabdus norvegica]